MLLNCTKRELGQPQKLNASWTSRGHSSGIQDPTDDTNSASSSQLTLLEFDSNGREPSLHRVQVPWRKVLSKGPLAVLSLFEGGSCGSWGHPQYFQATACPGAHPGSVLDSMPWLVKNSLHVVFVPAKGNGSSDGVVVVLNPPKQKSHVGPTAPSTPLVLSEPPPPARIPTGTPTAMITIAKHTTRKHCLRFLALSFRSSSSTSRLSASGRPSKAFWIRSSTKALASRSMRSSMLPSSCISSTVMATATKFRGLGGRSRLLLVTAGSTKGAKASPLRSWTRRLDDSDSLAVSVLLLLLLLFGGPTEAAN